MIQKSASSDTPFPVSSKSPTSPTASSSEFHATSTPTVPSFTEAIHWTGCCFHEPEGTKSNHKAVSVAVNAKFSLIAIGTSSGAVYIYSAQNYSTTPTLSHVLTTTVGGTDIWSTTARDDIPENPVNSLVWTSDGYVLSASFAVGGFAVWSVYGNLLCSTNELEDITVPYNVYHRSLANPSKYNTVPKVDEGILIATTSMHPSALMESLLPSREDEDWRIITLFLVGGSSLSQLAKLRRQGVKNAMSMHLNADNGSGNKTNGTGSTAHLEMIRQVSLIGIVARVNRVRGISLFSGYSGDQFTTIDDVMSANIILLVDGKLLMLIPRIPDDDDDSDLYGSNTPPPIRYELYVLADKIEYYWVGRKSVANMSTSLWAVTGSGIKIFTNLLRGDEYSFRSFAHDVTDSEPSTPTTPGFLASRANIGRPYSLGYRIGAEPTSPSASIVGIDGYSRWQTDSPKQLIEDVIYIPLDFYPHSVLLEKGIIAGIEQSMVSRDSLGYMIFKMSTKTLLFLHHVLRYLLKRGLEEDAVVFARAYEKLVYFGHALEILLHTILEEETDKRLEEDAILPLVIKFLDQFPHALDVIVSCARKTEVALWGHLFAAVGKPKDLFELCLADGRLRTATSYLIILQTMQPLAVGGTDTIRLLKKAMDENDYELCKELIRFLSSIDSTGKTLQQALEAIKLQMNGASDTSLPESDSAELESVVDKMENLNSV
ncbi:hypothetical protein EC973_000108 [Apophysomyces ossiformis]|uniref:RIC1 C-terminal alpha solenoid region domain-containing protein n=1 Tax=Apophysomyces ossiformis TaxID=679940 RepID=A0A8H7ETI8_9FUNG|nr:hypothetical protein EC973_000108 [Apophysomyces ossiformis]